MAKQFRQQNLLQILEESLYEPHSLNNPKTLINNSKITSLKRVIVLDGDQPR